MLQKRELEENMKWNKDARWVVWRWAKDTMIKEGSWQFTNIVETYSCLWVNNGDKPVDFVFCKASLSFFMLFLSSWPRLGLMDIFFSLSADILTLQDFFSPIKTMVQAPSWTKRRIKFMLANKKWIDAAIITAIVGMEPWWYCCSRLYHIVKPLAVNWE